MKRHGNRHGIGKCHVDGTHPVNVILLEPSLEMALVRYHDSIDSLKQIKSLLLIQQGWLRHFSSDSREILPIPMIPDWRRTYDG